MCMQGVLAGLYLCASSFDIVSAILFPAMPIWALTLCMWILCRVQFIWCTIATISSLLKWWCCKDGRCM